MKKYKISFTVELDDEIIHPDSLARWMREYAKTSTTSEECSTIVFLGAEEL